MYAHSVMKYSQYWWVQHVWVGKFQCKLFICVRLFFISIKKMIFFPTIFHPNFVSYSSRSRLEFVKCNLHRKRQCGRDRGRKHLITVQKLLFSKNHAHTEWLVVFWKIKSKYESRSNNPTRNFTLKHTDFVIHISFAYHVNTLVF